MPYLHLCALCASAVDLLVSRIVWHTLRGRAKRQPETAIDVAIEAAIEAAKGEGARSEERGARSRERGAGSGKRGLRAQSSERRIDRAVNSLEVAWNIGERGADWTNIAQIANVSSKKRHHSNPNPKLVKVRKDRCFS
ncbi:MAG: hypothetical protein WAN11_15535 [Syntrophobacteraceae bacterium]